MKIQRENYQSWGLNYNKKFGFEEYDLNKDKEDSSRIARMLRRKEYAEKMKFEEEHQFGYCPKCHCLIRMNGKCDNCD